MHLASPDPAAPPAIRPNYLSTEEDRRVAVQALRLARRIVGEAPLAKYRPQEHRPGPHLVSDAELLQAAGEIGTTIFHPVGTAKMGLASDPMAVLDERLRVRGVEGLAGRRRLGDAAHHLGQHQLAGGDDRREGRRHDLGRPALTVDSCGPAGMLVLLRSCPVRWMFV